MHPLLKISPRISVMPVIHGSADSALQVRKCMLEGKFDCLAVGLPPSFQTSVESGIDLLPVPTVVVQSEQTPYATEWRPDESEAEPPSKNLSYVPIDPCQPVIAGLRIAIGEHLTRRFIDLETTDFEPHSAALPDAFALKRLPIEKFASAILPFIQRPPQEQVVQRIRHMAVRLRELEEQHESILLLANILHWPWIREAYTEQLKPDVEDDYVAETELYESDPQTLLFMFGELPFITGLHERARAELDDDEYLSIDGVKELLLAARDAYRDDFRNRARPITTQTFSCLLKYIRNLTLTERRFAPDLYTIVIAAKQVAGDSFALHVAETARTYRYIRATGLPPVSFGIDRLRLPSGDVADAVSRLPGPPVSWRTCELHRRPDRSEQQQWEMKWNPFGQCSWPPEDELIENFRAHVTQKAQAIMGADLVKTEKFTSSVKDGIDIRDTLRNWHTGEIYVKEIPPAKGRLDAVAMIFDSPADPRDYSWRATWFAEHQNESTLAFYATDFMADMVGPGIGLATYGGAMFLFPPISIPDIWADPRLDFTDTMEERLIAATCMHSQSQHVALLSPLPPSNGWRRLAKRFKKRLVHVPLSQFSGATVQQLRMVHVLNGRQIRSFAQHFIRKA